MDGSLRSARSLARSHSSSSSGWAILRGFNVPPFFGKGAAGSVELSRRSPARRAEQGAADARGGHHHPRQRGPGLVAGTIAAVIVAVAFNLWGSVERAPSWASPSRSARSRSSPWHRRSVTLVFGRSMLAVVMIGAIVTFFPTLQ